MHGSIWLPGRAYRVHVLCTASLDEINQQWKLSKGPLDLKNEHIHTCDQDCNESLNRKMLNGAHWKHPRTLPLISQRHILPGDVLFFKGISTPQSVTKPCACLLQPRFTKSFPKFPLSSCCLCLYPRELGHGDDSWHSCRLLQSPECCVGWQMFWISQTCNAHTGTTPRASVCILQLPSWGEPFLSDEMQGLLCIVWLNYRCKLYIIVYCTCERENVQVWFTVCVQYNAMSFIRIPEILQNWKRLKSHWQLQRCDHPHYCLQEHWPAHLPQQWNFPEKWFARKNKF